MFPKSFLGARADALMDIVVLSLVIIVPTVIYSWKTAKHKNYSKHKKIQIALTLVLLIVVSLFEYDLRLNGGVFKMSAQSIFAGTLFLIASIYIHLFFAFSTAIIWLVLVPFSLFKFPKPPQPNPFSNKHRFWGKLGMIDMILTGITGIELYLVGFYL